MWNLIPHPTSTHTAYFWRALLPQKQEIPEKCDDDVIITFFQVFLVQEIPEKCDDDVIIMFFQVFIVFGVAGFVKIMQCGYSLDVEFNYASNKPSRSKFE